MLIRNSSGIAVLPVLKIIAASIPVIVGIITIFHFLQENTILKKENIILKSELAELKSRFEECSSEKLKLQDSYQNLFVNIIISGKIMFKDIAPLLPQNDVKSIENKLADVSIPLSAGWESQGTGNVSLNYNNGIAILNASLNGGDKYAELFLDLRGKYLQGIKKNSDGTCDFSNARLTANMKSTKNFKGDQNNSNGIQFILRNEKNNQWSDQIGDWTKVNDALFSNEGTTIEYLVPSNEITKHVRGLSLKFTIGTGSNANYDGSFIITSVKLSYNH